MSRSTFPPGTTRPAAGPDDDGSRLEHLYELARPAATKVAAAVLDKESSLAAKHLTTEALALLGEVLDDKEFVGHETFVAVRQQIAKRRDHGIGLKPDERELSLHADQIAQVLVRAWLQHLLDLRKGAYLPEDILPHDANSAAWNLVWDAVATYNVDSSDATFVLRHLCAGLSAQNGVIELPMGLRLSALAVANALRATSRAAAPAHRRNSLVPG